MIHTDVLIIGGGLSGLALASQLQSSYTDYYLVEARSRFGGRIDTRYIESGGQTGYFDLGPTWFWPGQPRIHQLLQDLNLIPFLQYSDGALSFEDEQGQVSQDKGYASMMGSYRIEGGVNALVEGLLRQLHSDFHGLGMRVTHIQQSDNKVLVQGQNEDYQDFRITCNRVVLALPPRVAVQNIQFSPPLASSEQEAMNNIATWMAGEAKVIAIYESPFWREAGLSGDVLSRKGPLVEIHDASPAEGGPYALFGFVGVPVHIRQSNRDGFLQATIQQLERLFGEAARSPVELIFQDWACEAETATSRDHSPLSMHPSYGLPHALSNLWDGKLLLGSTEVASNFGGYLEGALEASEMIAQKLASSRSYL